MDSESHITRRWHSGVDSGDNKRKCINSRLEFHSLEVNLYFTVYIVYISYGLWSMYNARDRILNIAKIEFTPGWWFIGRPRDVSNDELQNFNMYVWHNLFWYVLHIVVSFLVLVYRLSRRQSCGHALVSSVALTFTLHPFSLVALGMVLVSYYSISCIYSKRLMWLCTVLWMIAINVITRNNYLYSVIGYAEYYTVIIMLYWTLLRCCSFVLHRVNAGTDHRNHEPYSIMTFLGYTLYFPALVYGPFLGFRRYAAILETQKHSDKLMEVNLFTRILTFGWELLRVAFWWFIMELALHFIYVHYMGHDIEAVQLVGPSFGKHAIGYFMGQFFFLHYLVTYGLGISFARFDGINPPNRPRCIGRIHYYSDMWKYFDQGLYEFLLENIYLELRHAYSKLLATAVTFVFVFAWHGCYMYVLIWSALNFCCLVSEKLFKLAISWPPYVAWINGHLGIGGSQRLHALLATQLFIPAAFSNVYFISGIQVGNLLMSGAYMSGVVNYIALTFCCYCFFQCSEMMSNSRSLILSH